MVEVERKKERKRRKKKEEKGEQKTPHTRSTKAAPLFFLSLSISATHVFTRSSPPIHSVTMRNTMATRSQTATARCAPECVPCGRRKERQEKREIELAKEKSSNVDEEKKLNPDLPPSPQLTISP